MANVKSEKVSLRHRADEKQVARDRDARALAQGQKSREQLRSERSTFAFPRGRIMFGEGPLV